MGLMEEWRGLTWPQRIGYLAACAAADALMVALAWALKAVAL